LRIIFALHVIITVWSTPSSNKESSTHKRCRAGPNLLDLGNVVGKRREVIELLTGETVTLLDQFLGYMIQITNFGSLWLLAMATIGVALFN
jgi:hypothetical protein